MNNTFLAEAMNILNRPSDEQREELFPLLDGEDEPIADITHIVRRIGAIRHYERRIEALEGERDMLLNYVKEWYQRRIIQCESRIEHHKADLHAYMIVMDKSSVATPVGTVIRSNKPKAVWPEDLVLVDWAKRSGLAATCIRTTEAPDKKAIAAHIKETGEIPEGYTEQERTSISIRKA